MRLHRWFVVAVVAVLVGCGGDEGSAGGASGADPAQAVPAGSPVYVEAVVRPEGEQGDNAKAVLERFLGDRSLTDMIDEQLKEDGQTYAEDIEPWLGQRIGIGVFDLQADEPSFIGAVAITDAEKAEAALAENGEKEASYQDTQLYLSDDTYAGVAGDYIVFAGSEQAVQRGIDTVDGDSIAEDSGFEDAMNELPDERLGAVYVDTKAIGELAAQDPDVDPAARSVIEKFFAGGAPITAALTAQENGVTVESHVPTAALGPLGPLSTGEAPDLVADAPAGTWAVVGYKDVGETLKTTIETFAGAMGGAALSGQLESQIGINLDRDLFSWVGDLAVFVRGDSMSTLDGALVIQASDEDAAKAAIPRLVAAAKRSGAIIQPAQIDGADTAFATPLPSGPGPVILAYGNGRVVLAVGEEAAAEAIDPSETIDDTGLYGRAEDAIDDVAPSTIVDFETALKLIVESGAASDADFAEAQPYLDQLSLLVTGAEEDGDQLRSLFTVTLK
jgi:uncharacterized protein DUF3352